MTASRFHLALAVGDFTASLEDYSARLGCRPEVIVPNRYALWRTETLNISISKKEGEIPGTLRHVGWEDPEATGFTETKDCNGITWERFSQEQQRREIKERFGV